MEILNDLKKNVFKTFEDYLTLEAFEAWLYSSEALLDLMSKDVVLEAYAFNYRQDDARYQFKKAICNTTTKTSFYYGRSNQIYPI